MTVCALRSAAHIALRTFLRTYNRFDVVGREHLPAAESFVMVCNHSSHFDALCLLSSLPLRRVHRAFPAAAADYFFSSLLRTAFSVDRRQRPAVRSRPPRRRQPRRVPPAPGRPGQRPDHVSGRHAERLRRDSAGSDLASRGWWPERARPSCRVISPVRTRRGPRDVSCRVRFLSGSTSAVPACSRTCRPATSRPSRPSPRSCGTTSPAWAWGRQGCTKVLLSAVEEETLGEAMTLAWQNIARKSAATRKRRV